MSIKKLSIIIPVFNEARTIRELLQRVVNVELINGISKEIVIVNDCSVDNTMDLVSEFINENPVLEIRIINQVSNQGKGAAIQQGIELASSDYLIIQDADLEYDPKDYNLLLKPVIENHADVVYGSRFLSGSPHRVVVFWHYMGNKLLTLLSNMFSNLSLTDMETCYKLFRSDIIKNIPLTEKRFGFEPEVTAKLSRLKDIRIYEVGIGYQGRTYNDGKKINWKDGVRAIYCILKYNLLNKHTFNSKKLPFAGLILFLLTIFFVLIAYYSKDSYGGADDLHHYRISRYAFKYPHYFLDHWGKPVFTALSAPFAQFGYMGIKIYNVLCAILVAFFAWLLASNRKLNNPLLIIPFVLFTPVFASLIPSAMTEITGSLLLIMAVYLYFKENYKIAAVVISFLPFARTEGILLLPLFAFIFVLRRKWKIIPWLITGFILYSIIGSLYFNDFFWVINQIPYSAMSADIYDSGSIWYYIHNSKTIWGVSLALLFIPGLIVHFHELVRSKFSLMDKHLDEFVLLFLPIFGIVAFHSLAWYLGTGALALERFMALIVPPFVFFSLKGYNFIEKLVSFNKPNIRLILKFVILVLVIRTAFIIYKLPVPIRPQTAVLQEASDYILVNKLDTNLIHYYDPNVFFLLDIDPHDKTRIRELIPDRNEPGKDMEPGSILVWDAHYSANEGRLPMERVLESGRFETLAIFRPEHPFTVLGNKNYEVYVFQRKSRE